MPIDPVPPPADAPAAMPSGAATPATASTSATTLRRPLLSRKAWRLIGGAFAIGVLLFVVLWLRQRGRDEFFRVDPAAPGSAQPFDALPAPMPGADGSDATDRVRPGAASAPLPARAAPVAQAAAPAPDAAAPTSAGNSPVGSPATPGTVAAGDGPPAPIHSPPPAFPPAAMRNGDSGTVVLLVRVGADGLPGKIEVATTSRSRALDRAAVEAVEQWRFRPARRDGQPVAGDVRLPISFNPAR